MGGKSRKTVKKAVKGSPAAESSEFANGAAASHNHQRSVVKSERQGAGASCGFIVQENSVSMIPDAPGMRIRTEMAVSELLLHTRHRHRALSGTFCVEPFIVNTWIRTVLEDEFSHTVRVLISDNVVLSSTFKKSTDLTRYAKNRKVVINEPLYTVCDDGLTVVIVDDCRDISGKVIVCEPLSNNNATEDEDGSSGDDNQENRSKRDQKQQNGEVREGKASMVRLVEKGAAAREADRIRCEGNDRFTKKDFVGAMELYSKCITGCLQLLERTKGQDASSATASSKDQEAKLKKTLMLAYSNRSETWLRCRNFECAQLDASEALRLDPKHVKSLVRNGKALFELQSYEESAICFSSALEESPDDQQAQIVKAALARSKMFLEHSRDGGYDLNDDQSDSDEEDHQGCGE